MQATFLLARAIDGEAYSRLQYELERLEQHQGYASMKLIIATDRGFNQATYQLITILEAEINTPIHTHFSGNIGLHGLMLYLLGEKRTVEADGQILLNENSWVFDVPAIQVGYSTMKKHLSTMDENIAKINEIAQRQLTRQTTLKLDLHAILTGQVSQRVISHTEAINTGIAKQIESPAPVPMIAI